MNDLGQKCYDLYQQSLKNVESDSFHLADEVIIALWRTVEGLQQEKKNLEKILGDQRDDIRNYSYKLDILQSRVSSEKQH